VELTNDSNLSNEGEYSLGYTWNKSRKKKKKIWKGYWKKMINNFEGDVNIKCIFRKTKKERWKKVKHKLNRRNDSNIQENHINYCLNLSNISNEVWKRKWKQKILQRNKMLHTLKEVETNYKGFNCLQPKVDLKQFEETINLGDIPIEFMNKLAA
jgi:hypothetical protein